MIRHAALWALGLALASAPLPAWAQGSDTAAVAAAAADDLRAAADLLAGAQGAGDQIAALTATVRAYEDGLAALREGLRRAAIRQSALQAELAAQSDDIARLLGVLQTMGRTPEPLLLLHPSGPLGTARSGMILADVTPALQDRVAALRRQLQEEADLQALQASAAATLQAGLDGAQTARAALAQAMSDRADLPRRFTEDPVATALLLSSTDTLDGFAQGLGQIVDRELPVTAPQAQPGDLALPVAGTVLRGAGQPDAGGTVRPGILIATRPGALVSTPVATTVRFQGPLLDYGTVLILEPAPGILFVLAGLAQVYVRTGEVVPQGTPLGLMGGDMPQAQAILNDLAAGGGDPRSETLYLEVRDGQGPVDPADWFALE